MRLKISHLTKYHYDEPVHYALQQIRQTPKSGVGQDVLDWETRVEGGNTEVEFHDQFGNEVLLVSLEPGRTDISIYCEGNIDTIDTHGMIGPNTGYAPLWFFRRSTPLTAAGPLTRKLVKELGTDFDTEVTRMHRLSQLIAGNVDYQTGETHSETTVEEALATGKGVCQDHAQIFVSAVRLMGFSARYVSGYLMMDDRIEQDATHAWAEAFIPDVGWVGFDVSNGISPDERYVRVATGLDYKDAAPISGMRIGSSGESMNVSLQVQQQ
ncbi:transglutaminase domain-containing protein [Sneathiella sp.]|uniref:transglutaminase family protein n=1 Tax=Sneathiella sp. TaxID=1964365 RepID=UPI00356885A5